jgi:hypothetical protein
MSAEDRLRHLLRAAGPPPAASENDWSIFVHVAHRARRRHRVTAMVAAALLVGGAAGVWAVDRVFDQTMPPSNEPVEPVLLTDDLPRECPEAEPYEPESDLGAVAFVRNGDLFRTDLEGGEVKLVETGNRPVEPDVQWSPDGRWISFGGGVVVRARGGAVCAPIGAVSEPTWGADHTLVGWRDGKVLFGGPGFEERASDLKGHAAEPRFAIDDGRLVAIATPAPGFSGPLGEPAIWILDLATGNASRSHTLPPRSTPQIAGWSPDSQWIFYWTERAGGAPKEPRSLWGVQRRSPSDPVQVGHLYHDNLTWCGDTLIATAPDRRLIAEGRRLVAAEGPNWTPRPLTNLATDIWFAPRCSPEGDAVAATTTKVYPKPSDPRSISLLSWPDAALRSQGTWVGPSQIAGGPTEWSSDGNWVMFELKFEDREGVSLRLTDYLDSGRGQARGIRFVELGAEADVYGRRAYDWYQP